MLSTGESCLTNDDDASQQAVETDAGSAKSDDVEVDDVNDNDVSDDVTDDDDDVGIVFTVPATAAVREGECSCILTFFLQRKP